MFSITIVQTCNFDLPFQFEYVNLGFPESAYIEIYKYTESFQKLALFETKEVSHVQNVVSQIEERSNGFCHNEWCSNLLSAKLC